MKAVKLTKLVQEMNLKNLTPEVDILNILPLNVYRLSVM